MSNLNVEQENELRRRKQYFPLVKEYLWPDAPTEIQNVVCQIALGESMPQDLMTLCKQHNIEVFHVNAEQAKQYTAQAKDCDTRMCMVGEVCRAGWYWWTCVPGCIPDSDYAFGPFTSWRAAAKDAVNDL